MILTLVKLFRMSLLVGRTPSFFLTNLDRQHLVFYSRINVCCDFDRTHTNSSLGIPGM